MPSELATEYGVDRDGFERPGPEEIRDHWIEVAQQEFGRTLSGPTSAEVQFVDMLALASDTFWETLQAIYYGGKYPTAQGLQLSNVLALAGISRLPRQEATGEVTFFAEVSGGNNEDVTIPRNFKVATKSEPNSPAIIFVTTEATTLRAGQSAVTAVPVRALGPLETGPELGPEDLGEKTNVAENTIRTLIDSKSGIGGVTNPHPTGASGTREDGSVYDFTAGRDRETDPELRARYETSPALGGAATLGAVEASILNTGEGNVVRSVNVVENTKEEDLRPEGGPPPKAMRPTVSLEADTEANREAVAQTIHESRAGGIECYGEINKRVELEDGTLYPPQEIMATTDAYGNIRCRNGFDLATQVPIYIHAELVTLPNVPENIEAILKAQLLAYIGGDDGEGGSITGESGVGDDLYADRIGGILMAEEYGGVREITEIGIETSPNPTIDQNISIDNNEEAVTHPNWISIETTPGVIE